MALCLFQSGTVLCPFRRSTALCPFRHVMALCPFQYMLCPFRYGTTLHPLLGYFFWGQFGARLWLQSTECIPHFPEAALGLLKCIWNRGNRQRSGSQARTQEGLSMVSYLSSPRERPKDSLQYDQSSAPAMEHLPPSSETWESGIRGFGSLAGVGWELPGAMLAFYWQSLQQGPDPGVPTLLCLRHMAEHSSVGLGHRTAPLNLPPQSLLSRGWKKSPDFWTLLSLASSQRMFSSGRYQSQGLAQNKVLWALEGEITDAFQEAKEGSLGFIGKFPFKLVRMPFWDLKLLPVCTAPAGCSFGLFRLGSAPRLAPAHPCGSSGCLQRVPSLITRWAYLSSSVHPTVFVVTCSLSHSVGQHPCQPCPEAEVAPWMTEPISQGQRSLCYTGRAAAAGGPESQGHRSLLPVLRSPEWHILNTHVIILSCSCQAQEATVCKRQLIILMMAQGLYDGQWDGQWPRAHILESNLPMFTLVCYFCPIICGPGASYLTVQCLSFPISKWG